LATRVIGGAGGDCYIGGTLLYHWDASNESSTYWVAKYSKTGAKLWEKTIRDTLNSWTTATGLIMTSDSNIVACGPVKNKCYVVKYNPTGTILWEKNYSNMVPQQIIETHDHNLLIAGFTGYPDAFLLKISGATGGVLWMQVFGSASNEEQSFGLAQTTSHDYLLLGRYYHPYDQTANPWLVLADSTGIQRWSSIISQYTCNSYFPIGSMGFRIVALSNGEFVYIPRTVTTSIFRFSLVPPPLTSLLQQNPQAPAASATHSLSNFKAHYYGVNGRRISSHGTNTLGSRSMVYLYSNIQGAYQSKKSGTNHAKQPN
jgi:hypothetical protein